jgi:hypothetical protein
MAKNSRRYEWATVLGISGRGVGSVRDARTKIVGVEDRRPLKGLSGTDIVGIADAMP